MKTIVYHGHRLRMHDSIEEMPITRFQDYNRYLLIDSEIGSDAAAIDRHLGDLARFNGSGDKQKAALKIAALRQSIEFVVSSTSPEMNAFVSLIAEMNGQAIRIASDEDTREIITELGRKGLTLGKVRGFLEHVKKNLLLKWKNFFQPKQPAPPKFANSTVS